MILQVESTIGTFGEEEPRAFQLGATRVVAAEILDRWPGIDLTYFKVHAGDGATYILRHDRSAMLWELILYKASGW
jgi:hypothetical protein